MKIKEFICDNKENTIYSIRNIKEQPLESLGKILPIGMVCTSVIGFIVAIIMFVANSGFANQISAISGDFFAGILEGFTSGTANILTSGTVSGIIFILLVVELVVMIISYMKTETKAKKITACICLGVGTVLFTIAGLILAVGFGVINLSVKIEEKIINMLSMFNGVQTSTIVSGLKITALIGVAALIVFIILMFMSEHRWMIKHSVIALIITQILLPLVLLFVENIIPMSVGIIAIVIIGRALFIGGKIFLRGGGGESSGSYSSAGCGYSETSRSVKSEAPAKKTPYQNEIEDWSGPFWRDKGGLGILQAQEDHIYCYNVWKEATPVCGVSAFEKGEVAIIDCKTKTRVMNVAGCKRPAR